MLRYRVEVSRQQRCVPRHRIVRPHQPMQQAMLAETDMQMMCGMAQPKAGSHRDERAWLMRVHGWQNVHVLALLYFNRSQLAPPSPVSALHPGATCQHRIIIDYIQERCIKKTFLAKPGNQWRLKGALLRKSITRQECEQFGMIPRDFTYREAHAAQT